MKKRYLLGVMTVLCAFASTSAYAACPAYTYTFTNGTVGDATQIDSNFNTIMTCANTLAPTASPALTGTPTAPTATAGTNTTQIATTAFVQSVIPTASSGDSNKFRNGTFDIWQRGTSALATSTTGAYTADGWIVKQTGAAFTCARDTGNGGTLYSLSCAGGTGNTDTIFKQRLESYVAAPLAGSVITVQFWFRPLNGGGGGGSTPKISTCYASSQDNFATCTADLAATSITSCTSMSWCLEAYTFTASASASMGYEIDLDCNEALTASQHCRITAADIRSTPGLSTGVNANPPPPELRPVGIEMPFNQRYLQYFLATSSGILLPGVGLASSASQILFSGGYLAPMRAAPTVTSSGARASRGGSSTSATVAGAPDATQNILSISATGTGFTAFSPYVLVGSTAGVSFISLSAEL